MLSEADKQPAQTIVYDVKSGEIRKLLCFGRRNTSGSCAVSVVNLMLPSN